MTKTYHLISLGCAKNTVDSDSMSALLDRDGFIHQSDPADATFLIVNTCGFIKPAREESYGVLRDLAANKSPDQYLIAAGCLTQLFSTEVVKEVPSIDGIIGTRRWMDILGLIQSLRTKKHPEPLYHLPETPIVGQDEQGVIRTSVQGASAYLKIADGCRRPCAFCSIPLIKGTLVSRPMESILKETRILIDQGIQEINLIAQDTTDYGNDLGMKDGLSDLLDKMIEIVPEDRWIRLLYAYPGYVTDRMIDLMASSNQIVNYLDMPLQHAHPETLKRMRRPANANWVHETIAKMRSAIPALALRTTFIVGYPGETEEEFKALLDFVKEMQFDKVGVFPFSFEPGTFSEPLGDPISEGEKLDRIDRLMTLQQEISLAKNQSLIGQELSVLIEGHGEIEGSDAPIAIGRSYRDAPEIDGLVFVEGTTKIGSITTVQINGAMTYDLTAIPLQ